MNKALLVIDMLNDFVLDGAPLQVPDTKVVIPFIQKEIENARKNSIPVIYLCDSHGENDPEFKIWPKHCVKGTSGAKIIDELTLENDDMIIEKTTYDGFYKTELENILRQKGVDTLVLTGCVTNICILYTAASGRARGFDLIVPEKSVAHLGYDDHKWALKQMKDILYAKII